MPADIASLALFLASDQSPQLATGGKFLNLQGGHYFNFGKQAAGKGRFMSDFWTQVSTKWADAEGVKPLGPTEPER